MSTTKIDTFIFLDIEGSGSDSGNEIAELALIAVHRQAMQPSGKLPRVLDKLVLCVDPGVAEVKCKASGLTRAMMEESGKTKFDDSVGNQIVQFMERQAKPACLISHNESDFLILSKKLASVGVTIPEIRCGDSLKAFRVHQPVTSKRGRYNLNNLYIRAFGRSPENQHNAEMDAIALMKVVMKAGIEMVMWFDRYGTKTLPRYQYDS